MQVVLLNYLGARLMPRQRKRGQSGRSSFHSYLVSQVWPITILLCLVAIGKGLGPRKSWTFLEPPLSKVEEVAPQPSWL